MNIVDMLHRLLYPGQFEIIPGEFESFLTGVTDVSEAETPATTPRTLIARR